jgi:o-succinylbenzoate synthase
MSQLPATDSRLQVPIEQIILHPIAMQLVETLQTSGWNESFRPAILVEIHAGGEIGWGECVAGWTPGYSAETIGTAMHVLSDFIIPALIGKSVGQMQAMAQIAPQYRGHPMAKSAIDMALCDLAARLESRSLAVPIPGDLPLKSRVTVGVSIGIHPTIDATIAIIDKRIREGYRRIKLKIKPGWDLDLLREVRRQYPNVALMADANSAYRLDQLPILKQFDDLNLLMIEQPLSHDDIYDHAALQKQLATPICLDESIHTVNDARMAILLNACRIINLKVSRMGGLHQARALHDFCYEKGVPLWIGGMLETGIGRAANLITAALPGVTLPSDISGTNRYYDPDLIEENFVLNAEDSTITVPTGPGLGVTLKRDRLGEAEDAFNRFPKSAFLGPKR